MKKSKKAKNSKSLASYLYSAFYHIDIFKMDVSFREDGAQSLSSPVGILISLAILTVVCIYGTNKFNIFLDREDTSY